MHDLGDVIALGVEIRNAAGALADATAVACSLDLPDGTTVTLSVARTATGKYATSYTPTLTGTHFVRWVATGTNASAYSDAFTVIDPADLSIVSLNEAKAHLNIETDEADDELRAVLLAATCAIEEHLRRPVRRRTESQTFPVIRGNGNVLVLSLPDVASITSIVEDGETLTADDYVAHATAGVVYRDGGTWTPPVVVTWVTDPVDTPTVRQACLEMTRHLWTTQRGSLKALPRSGDVMGMGSNPGSGYSLPNRVAELLAPNRTHA